MRELQLSILPAGAPEVPGLRIAAAYEPMTAVAGDFYEFIQGDNHGIGFLVADVSGHGVPAALIASMIKVAAQSVNGCASDPANVIRKLGNTLSSHLRGQFVSAAYLWMDAARVWRAILPPDTRRCCTGGRRMRSSRALKATDSCSECCPTANTRPAIFQWQPETASFLYTDGVTEPENAAGEAFGENRLEQIMREGRAANASEMSARLVTGVRQWQASPSAQDDITLLVVDVV